MLRERKIKIIILILFILLIIILLIMQVKYKKITLYTNAMIERMTSSEPINLDNGEINNEYFMIDSEGRNANETTKGINKAIEYASKNNIEYIKLRQGTYLINGLTESYQNTGIILESNICLDLNGSTIKQISNNSKGYVNISIYNVENVIILNGILIGDVEEHSYESGTTDEWGHGIIIRGSKNIVIENCNILNMTGDGIYIAKLEGQSYEDGTNSENIQIKNSYIHDCRRQGISIISGINIKIYDNEIFNMSGVSPKSGIDLESNNSTERIDNIEIYRNKFYNLGSNRAIKIDKFTYNAKIYENEITGRIYVYDDKGKIIIEDNSITNGGINFYNNNTDVKYLNNAMIRNNYLYNSEINLYDLASVYLENNNIFNAGITINNVPNIIAINNKVTNTKDSEMEYGYIYMSEKADTNILYKYNNAIDGKVTQKEFIGENITVVETENEVNNKIKEYL